MEEDYLSLANDLRHAIIGIKWNTVCGHPSTFKSQIVKEFHSNLSTLYYEKKEAMVKRKVVRYLKAMINMHFGIKETIY